MLLGTIIVAAATLIASESIGIVVISSVLGLALGGVFGYFIKTNYSDAAPQMTELQRSSLRALLMIKRFSEISNKYNKDIVLLFLQKVIREGKELMMYSENGRHSTIGEYK